ncbi:hypothetical protein EDM68_00585 [Candidatus Uhrbacteria bacterium]|nr:MAG: hypothetical protein EDM68_00585 [Candidatus Uhrbacteria bacterium]
MKNQRLLVWSIGTVIVLLLSVFGWWFWSLGTVRAGATPVIAAEVVTPPVEIRRTGSDTWRPLDATEPVLPGDRIRTGAEGEARITWGDRGYTRIDPSSELVIERAPLEGHLTPGADIGLAVEGGRIWSRMLKLLDLDSSMQVRTSDVVATVRGTTFGIIKDADGSQAAVTESVVEISGSAATTLLRDNQWGLFLPGGLPHEVRDLRPDDAWAQEHMRRDREDDAKFAEYLRDRAERRAAEFEGAPLFLVEASERLRLRFATGARTSALAAAYAERRLGRALIGGDERDWRAFVRYADQAGTERGRLIGLVHAALSARLRERGTEAFASELAYRRALADPSEAARAYLDALMLDERIDDAVLREERRNPDALGRLAQDIGIFETRIESLNATETEKEGLRDKAAALRKRLEYVLGLSRPEPGPEPVPEPVPQPIQGRQIPDPAQPTPPILKPAEEPVTPTQTPTLYARFSLLAAPSIVDIGQPVRLTLYGITAEGRADDLTASATFSSGRASDGSFDGNLFTPAVAGTITLYGAYADASGTRTASASITVRAPQADTGLKDVRISFTGPTTLPCSGRSSFKVIATYGDGRTQDVTMLARLTVSDPKLIYANNEGTLLTFCAAETSTATLTASYTEREVTRGASATITVEPEPPPTSGGGQQGGAYYLY